MSSKGAVCYNYVTVVNKAKPNAAGKKILIPPNMSALKSNAAKALNLPADKPIQAIFSSENIKIKSVNEIIPNTKVFVSTEIDENSMTSSNQMTQNLIALQNANQGPSFAQGKTSQNQSALSFIGSTSILSPSRNQSILISRPPSTLQSRVGSRSPSSLMIVTNTESPSRARRRRGQEYAITEISQFQEEDNDKKRFEKSGISHRSIETLLSFFPREVVFTADGTQAIVKNISPLTARFSSRIRDFQQLQDAYFFKRITQNVLKIPPHSSSLDEKATEIVNNATFDTPNMTYTRFKAVVIGPHQGGKSTFLQILASRTLLRLIGSGQYKRTLFFMFDFKKVAINSPNAIQFYNNFIKIIFEQITNQRIDLQPYCEMLIAHFQKLTTIDSLPVIPQKFTLDDDFYHASTILSELTANLYNSLHKSHSLRIFLTNVIMLPHYISLAFGFNGIHFVIDHLDKSDYDFQPEAPLDGENRSANLLEYIKFMISNESFVVSCKDEEKFIESLSLQTNDGVDLLDGLELISITDIDHDPEHSNDFEYVIACDDIADPIVFKLADCGGCSGFTTRWDEIIEVTKEIEQELNRSPDSGKAKEAKLYLLKRLREFIPLVLKKFDPKTYSLEPLSNKVMDYEIHTPKLEEEDHQE